jgi:hypothetical protein
MNSEQNDFEALRKLMALKRHEQPPPEYLNGLSGRIITRIEHGEGRLTLWERLSANVAVRPTMAYAFGLTVCGALGLTAVYMVRQEMADAADPSAVAVRVPAPAMAAIASQDRTDAPLHVANWLGKTNPAVEMQPELSLFAAPPAAVTVSYHPGN